LLAQTCDLCGTTACGQVPHGRKLAALHRPGQRAPPSGSNGWPRAAAQPWLSAHPAMRRFIGRGPHGAGRRNSSLESCLRSKDARAVRSGAVGEVPDRATRWRPTTHAGFKRGG
jgi:hypothetical protein